jgi:dipeptide/tripeptide permease
MHGTSIGGTILTPPVNSQRIHDIVTLILSVFFLYFVLIGGSCASLLQCRIQRYVTESLLFKHLMLFMSVLIFTFVLNWYSDKSTFPQWNLPDDKERLHRHPERQLVGWLGASVAIYAFVILLNKCEWQYFVVVAVLMCIILVLFTFLKMYTYKYAEVITNEQQQTLVRMHQATVVLFVIVCVVIAMGVYAYYCRQCIEHRRKWSWTNFVFAGCVRNCN